jgi:hypothetical protein
MASTDDPGRRDLPLIGLMLYSFATLIKGEGRTPPLSCCHAFWGPGVTTYPQNGDEPKHAQTIANHKSPSPTNRTCEENVVRGSGANQNLDNAIVRTKRSRQLCAASRNNRISSLRILLKLCGGVRRWQGTRTREKG